MENKSPISLLYEFCSINHIGEPTFNLIMDRTCVLDTEFMFEVYINWEGSRLRATGKGKNKKEAKHDAAKAMLEQTSKLNSPLAKNVIVPQETSPKTDRHEAIKELMDVCHDRNLPAPEFVLIADEGLPHLKQFTIKCKVATFERDATAATKKAAKQLSAYNMAQLLQTLKEIDVPKPKPVKFPSLVLNKVMFESRKPNLYDDCFASLDVGKRQAAINILQDNSLGHEEKMKKTLDFLNLKFKIFTRPTIKKSFLYFLEVLETEPELMVFETSLPLLYEKTNEYLNVFLI
ncbi:interferon-inducible double-stranded RNA-dependent protein kinase activator A homolog A-like [Ctenocephalides felis]|uniref:interferon-inducible double-stranded RNA-dependent protein kinase activator A homolog A-like n=1 Tax=Ctenocephalides felis TaxID=7515 RepID=UPI000E6E24AD|nr:interferon-inducible double-stranded RNA-dependent protein kinase activator A homolog A-like [Ctenocephalides felis]XP_026470876.1 interferon-inducible double-stranded RNA-dependent protein kinase activator A homolog A-like [Ctenocephalides felis]XP_026470877.1 interferon-inducible double-stranded RNA-dependent protein kinase activator A homolog A-like [Ctenocephalides felis]